MKETILRRVKLSLILVCGLLATYGCGGKARVETSASLDQRLTSIEHELVAIREQLGEQGRMLKTMYDFLDREVDLTAQQETAREDEILRLEAVCQIADENLTSKARFSPSKNQFAALAGDGSIWVFKTDGKLVRKVRCPGERVTAFTYSPEGQRLLAGTHSGKIFLCSLDTGACHLVFEKPDTEIGRVVWLGESDRAAWGTSRVFEVRKEQPAGSVFSVETGKELWEFSCFVRADFQTLAASPDGKWLAVLEIPGKDRGVFLLKANDGQIGATLVHQEYRCGPLSAAVAPDNNTVAVGYAPCHVILWDRRRQEVIRLLEAHSNWVVSLAFSANCGLLVSGGGDSTARVWDVTTGKELGRIRFPGRSTYVESVAFSPDGRLVLAAASGRIVLAKAPSRN